MPTNDPIVAINIMGGTHPSDDRNRRTDVGQLSGLIGRKIPSSCSITNRIDEGAAIEFVGMQSCRTNCRSVAFILSDNPSIEQLFGRITWRLAFDVDQSVYSSHSFGTDAIDHRTQGIHGFSVPSHPG